MSNNFNYRIYKDDYIVCDSIPRNGFDKYINILADPFKLEPGKYTAKRGAHREDIEIAAQALNVTIYRYTKKLGTEVFGKT